MKSVEASYKINSTIFIEVDDNPDDIHREGFHCHANKSGRGRDAQIFLEPSCRFSHKPDNEDLNFSEQNDVLKYCEKIRSQLISDCKCVLAKKDSRM